MQMNTQTSSATFAIVADLCPQVLCRLLGMIAQQDRMVEQVDARRRPKSLHVRMSVSGLEAHHAEVVAAKMRSLVRVRSVRLLTGAGAA